MGLIYDSEVMVVAIFTISKVTSLRHGQRTSSKICHLVSASNTKSYINRLRRVHSRISVRDYALADLMRAG